MNFGEAAAAAVTVSVVVGVVRATRAARRRGTPLRGYLCWYVTAALLLIGLGGVLGPSALVLPGTLVMFAALGPPAFLACAALLRRGPVLPSGAFRWHRRIAVVVAAVAAPVALTGAVAYFVHNSGGYAMRYGDALTTTLPGKCEPDGGATCSSGLLLERGDPTSVSDDEYREITVHFTAEGWSRYRRYYAPFGAGSYKPGSSQDPTSVTLDIRVVDHDAYVAIGYRADALTPLGRDPFPRLAWAALPALLIPLWLGRGAARRQQRSGNAARQEPWSGNTVRQEPQSGNTARQRQRAGNAGAGPAPRRAAEASAGRSFAATGPVSRPRYRPYSLTVSSRQVRVTVSPEKFVVEQELTGADGTTRRRTHVELAWRDIREMAFDNDHRDPVVSLYVHPVRAARAHALDASHLATADWAKVADAVASNTDGRITLTLSDLRGRRVNPDV